MHPTSTYLLTLLPLVFTASAQGNNCEEDGGFDLPSVDSATPVCQTTEGSPWTNDVTGSINQCRENTGTAFPWFKTTQSGCHDGTSKLAVSGDDLANASQQGFCVPAEQEWSDVTPYINKIQQTCQRAITDANFDADKQVRAGGYIEVCNPSGKQCWKMEIIHS